MTGRERGREKENARIIVLCLVRYHETEDSVWLLYLLDHFQSEERMRVTTFRRLLWGAIIGAVLALIFANACHYTPTRGASDRRLHGEDDISGAWVAQFTVWNNAAHREQHLTRYLVLDADGSYLSTIRVNDPNGTSTFPTLKGHWDWATINGSKQFCVTPDAESQHFPHCYPVTVEPVRFQWGEAVFVRVAYTTIQEVIEGKDSYPDPASSDTTDTVSRQVS